ncbi:MAG: MFS transporter [Bradyrhizobium sp.]|nr:MAG: MFS transporter [Bradyrhizobium sp.]
MARRITPRASVAAMFLTLGFALGLWSGAAASIVSRVGVSAFAYGLALTLFTGAYLAAMSWAGAIAQRFSLKRTLIAAALTAGPALAVLLRADQVVGYFILQGVFGFVAGLTDLTMNAAGARIERSLGRPILAGLHGAASTGIALGAALGGLLAASAEPWIASVAAIVALWTGAAAIGFALPADRGDPIGAVALDRPARLSRTLVAIGLVIGVSIACESAAMFWSGLVLRQEAPQWAQWAGLGTSFFAGCQASVRFNVDRLRARIADWRLIEYSLIVATCGFFIVAGRFGFAASIAGFAIIGFGTGAVVPCGFALAASRPGISAAVGLSTAAFFGSFARLPAPLVTGSVADALSLSGAFLLFALLLIGALAITLRTVGSTAA